MSRDLHISRIHPCPILFPFNPHYFFILFHFFLISSHMVTTPLNERSGPHLDLTEDNRKKKFERRSTVLPCHRNWKRRRRRRRRKKKRRKRAGKPPQPATQTTLLIFVSPLTVSLSLFPDLDLDQHLDPDLDLIGDSCINLDGNGPNGLLVCLVSICHIRGTMPAIGPRPPPCLSGSSLESVWRYRMWSRGGSSSNTLVFEDVMYRFSTATRRKTIFCTELMNSR